MSLRSIKSVDYVVVPCRNLETARHFYTSVLGFNIAYERDDWIRFQIGPIALALRPESGPFAERTVIGPALQLAFQVPYEDVDRCHDELKRQAVNVLQPPTDQPWGHRTLFFTDPEGNVLEIYAEATANDPGSE